MSDHPRMLQAPPRSRPAGATTVAVNYGRDIGWAGTRDMEVQRNGETNFFTTFNDRGREIGSWRAIVPPASFDELVARLHTSGYERIVTETTFEPGTKVITIGERLEGEKLPTIYSFLTVPPALAPVIALFEELETQVRAHPVRVLRGSAAWANAEVSSGDEAVIEVTLANVGAQPFEMSNPLHDFGDPRHDTGGWNGLRLAFSKESGGGGEKQYDLTAADVRAPPNAVRSETCLMQPGQSLRFEARKKTDLGAGKYRVRVEYSSMVNRDADPNFVDGVLWLEPGPLSIKGGPWWRPW